MGVEPTTSASRPRSTAELDHPYPPLPHRGTHEAYSARRAREDSRASPAVDAFTTNSLAHAATCRASEFRDVANLAGAPGFAPVWSARQELNLQPSD